jgi:hypothetical protein
MKLNMLEYYKIIKEQHINIIYSGPLWSDGIEGIAEILRKRLSFDDIPVNVSMSVFSVFIEQISNMLMYSEDKGQFSTQNTVQEVPIGAFIFGTAGKTYFIQSGNTMKTADVDELKSRIDHLNTLDTDGLRKLYKEQLKGKSFNAKGKSAGLGFIEIARRASSPIEYEFTPFDSELSFFTMYVTIGQEKEK